MITSGGTCWGVNRKSGTIFTMDEVVLLLKYDTLLEIRLEKMCAVAHSNKNVQTLNRMICDETIQDEMEKMK